ncbi:VOC family protein [Streptomyces triticagri]|uniref:VOC family protein n=1 Tax=Streptomyces triticagri TaxID=2293568 RepID=A0A372M469_9ACTN|nr:VOC family protein [Streptomyces triticagri]RFU85738.1 VOC family protein [Streptomyces triticagri]
MIKGLGISTVWVLDQDRAKEFYTEKLGLELRADMTLGEGGMRWLTVGAKDQPELQLTLMVPGGAVMDEESAQAVRTLVAKGMLGAGSLTTDDIHGDCAKFKARGVEFVQEPQERPYGTEAVFRDDSGHWFSFTQPRAGGLDVDQDWGCAAND